MMPIDLTERITTRPSIRGGMATVRGLPISVEEILRALGSGVPEEELLRAFPELERDDLRAAQLYAADRVAFAGNERTSVTPPRVPTQLPPEESALLQRINEGLPGDVWERYHTLVARRRAETLTDDEYTELCRLTDEVEMANARRLEYLAELARIRGTSIRSLMKQLELTAPEDA